MKPFSRDSKQKICTFKFKYLKLNTKLVYTKNEGQRITIKSKIKLSQALENALNCKFKMFILKLSQEKNIKSET